MKTLREAVAEAQEKKVAIGHFNVSDSTQFHAIVEAARELGVPVIIGVSEGERKFIGTAEVAALVRAAREKGLSVYTNADHTHSLDDIKEAVEVGFDAVIFDGSKLPFEENIAKTKEAVTYVREQEALRQTQGDQNASILIEGEYGYIGSSSKLLDEVPEDVDSVMTDPEKARQFVEETGIDLFSPAVGNLHGALKDRPNPALNIERVAQIRDVVGVPMVLHGGSGISDDDFRAAIAAGMAIVHINTEIRVAYRKGIEKGLAEAPDDIAPYKYMQPGKDAVKEVVLERLKLFNGIAA